MNWQILFLVVILAFMSGIIWMAFALCRFHSVGKRLPDKWWKRMLCGLVAEIILMYVGYLTIGFVSMMIAFLHLLVIWMICDVIMAVTRLITKKAPRHYYPGISAILITVIWLSVGWYNAFNVVRTEYNLTTRKPIGRDIKIVGLSDSHIGSVFHWQKFEEYIKQINEENPDMVVIMGDFIDDGTSREDMEKSCDALGKLKTRYGVYYVFGNHDEGFRMFNNIDYSVEDFVKHLTDNNVRILRDESVRLDDSLYICGRLDRTRYPERKSAMELMKGMNPDAYVICLDHQPNDYEAEAQSNMGLVLCGHTHGGQLMGLGEIGVKMGANDAFYGLERRRSTDFIISSGIGDWEIKFKTGCIAEYIVVNVKKQ